MAVIGYYHGVPINSGTDAQIQAQMAQIDRDRAGGSSSSSSKSNSSSGSSGSSSSQPRQTESRDSNRGSSQPAQSYSVQPPSGVSLGPGSSGSQVRQLQDWLVSVGYMNQAQVDTGYGTYGPQTERAVAAWQRDNGVDTAGNPGWFGPRSYQAAMSGGSSGGNQQPGGQVDYGQQGTDVPGQQAPNMMDSQGQPYFRGDNALVKVYGVNGYDSNTLWLVDVKEKTMRPFASDQAVQAFYGMSPLELGRYVNHVSSDIFAPGSALNGFTPLSSDYAIQEDGRARAYSGDAATLSLRYGSQNYDTNREMAMTSGLDGFLDILKNTGQVDQATIDKIGKDQSQMAFYISALAYGGYSLSDIYRDVKRRELIANGDRSMEDVLPISPSQTRAQYQGSTAYKRAETMNELKVPANLGNLSPETLNLSLYDVPDEAFKTLIPLLDPDSPEFWEKMDEAVSVIYEAQLQMLDARNEQDLQMAQTQWEMSKKKIEDQLGISLSNNALEAWNQIESIRDQSSTRGVYGSGLMNEQVDDYLRNVRRQDQLNRDATMTEQEAQEMSYYQKFASPDEIANLDPEKRRRWGLETSQEIKDYFTMDNLKKLFPKERDEALQAIINSYLDPNGNLYSNLYAQYNKNKYDMVYDPSSGYNTWKSSKVIGDALLDEEAKYANYTTPDSPFLRYTGDDVDIPDHAGVVAPKTVNLSSAARKALDGLLNRPAGVQTPQTGSGQVQNPQVQTPAKTGTGGQTLLNQTVTQVTPPKITSTPATPATTPTGGMNMVGGGVTYNSGGMTPYVAPKQTPYEMATGKTAGSSLTSQGKNTVDSIFGKVKSFFGVK